MKTKTLKTTHNGIIAFINFAQRWLSKNDPEVETKPGYAVKRELDRARAIHQRFQTQQEELNIKHALTDPSQNNKVIRVVGGNGYEFNKEGLLALNKDCNALLDSTVEIEPYIATEKPKKGWTQNEKDNFAGFVIDIPREE